MNKKVKILIGIIIGIIALYLVIFFTDYYRCSHFKEPVFAIAKDETDITLKEITYQGLGYKVKVEKDTTTGSLLKVEMYMFDKFIAGAIADTASNLTQNNSNGEIKSYVRAVKVGGKLYYDTGEESTVTARCGVMDGEITSNVNSDQIPTEDNQSNFEGNYGYQYGADEGTIEILINDKWYVFKAKSNSTEGITTALTLEDEIEDNTVWCGTFQLIWNDLKNDLAKQDIVFIPQLNVVENLNKETFKTSDLSEDYYYKKIGRPSLELKSEIEKAIKDKFNETSDILDDFEWENRDPNDYFLYAMLKKEFQFEKEFEELDKGSFGDYENISYFGISENCENDELRKQVKVLYYNSKDDFAIKLETKQEDEVILCKSPNGNTFNEIYNNIKENEQKYTGMPYIIEGELVKVPNIKVDEKVEFKEIENIPFYFSNGDMYSIEQAMQTIKFELDRTGGKIKSEAGMMNKAESAIMREEVREFSIDDTFAIFLIESGKENPYFAGKISDITKFQ